MEGRTWGAGCGGQGAEGEAGRGVDSEPGVERFERQSPGRLLHPWLGEGAPRSRFVASPYGRLHECSCRQVTLCVLIHLLRGG